MVEHEAMAMAVRFCSLGVRPAAMKQYASTPLALSAACAAAAGGCSDEPPSWCSSPEKALPRLTQTDGLRIGTAGKAASACTRLDGDRLSLRLVRAEADEDAALVLDGLAGVVAAHHSHAALDEPVRLPSLDFLGKQGGRQTASGGSGGGAQVQFTMGASPLANSPLAITPPCHAPSGSCQTYPALSRRRSSRLPRPPRRGRRRG